MKMKRYAPLLLAAGLGLSACANSHGHSHDHSGEFVLGAATDHNIAAQSTRSVEVPNSNGLTGQSGERAVAAITRLNAGEATELSDVSSSGIGSTSDD